MCIKSQNDMIVRTLHNGTNLETNLQNAQLSHGSNVKTIGVQTMQMAVRFLPTHFPSSPMCRIDLLSSAATVLATSQRGKTLMAASRAKMGVSDSRGTAFCVVSLALGCQNVHPMAGYNRCLHRFLSSKNHNKKTEHWAVCHCM